MAITYGMGGGTPMVSSTMPPPTTSQMTAQNTSGMNMGGFTRNMTLPLSMNPPIDVNENTPNLEEIQSFPVAGRALDGTHFHQDPITGQMYRMTDELHARIPQILASRQQVRNNFTPTSVINYEIVNVDEETENIEIKRR